MPTNSAELLLSICTMIIGCGVFAFSLNSVGTIMLALNEDEAVKQENLYIINNYMRRKEVSSELKFKVRG